MVLYRLHLVCPRCGHTAVSVSEQPNPRMRCGDCLMLHTEIVELKIVKTKMETDNG